MTLDRLGCSNDRTLFGCILAEQLVGILPEEPLAGVVAHVYQGLIKGLEDHSHIQTDGKHIRIQHCGHCTHGGAKYVNSHTRCGECIADGRSELRWYTYRFYVDGITKRWKARTL